MKLGAALLAAIVVVLSGCSFSVSFGGAPENFYRPDPGQILFGTDLDPTFMYVKDKYSSVAMSDAKVAVVGTFTKAASGQMTVMIAKDGSPPQPAGGIMLDAPGTWFSGKYALRDFPGPGHYVFTMVVGGETLATGALDIST